MYSQVRHLLQFGFDDIERFNISDKSSVLLALTLISTKATAEETTRAAE
jgi:hypothetical protein